MDNKKSTQERISSATNSLHDLQILKTSLELNISDISARAQQRFGVSTLPELRKLYDQQVNDNEKAQSTAENVLDGIEASIASMHDELKKLGIKYD
ncbi:hypothetical protein AB6D11_02970 [Vibrio splendidus]